MSRLYFVTEDDDVELKGWEYHWIKSLADDITEGFLSVQYDADDWVPLINPAHYMAKQDYRGANCLSWGHGFKVALRSDGGGSNSLLMWKGKPINGWHLMLNTAIILGGDAVKLGARLGAQGEIHAWINGPNRAWVADMIEHAVKSGVYREGLPRAPLPVVNEDPDPRRFTAEPAGWSNVVKFLRADDTKPVVTWYSISESFPDPEMIGVGWDEWEDLPGGEQWSRCMDSLRSGEWAQRYKGLEIKPDDWDTFRFGHTLSVLDLRRPNRDELLDRVLAKGWLK